MPGMGMMKHLKMHKYVLAQEGAYAIISLEYFFKTGYKITTLNFIILVHAYLGPFNLDLETEREYTT